MTATFASHRSKAAQLPRWIQRVLDGLRRSHRQGAFGTITEAAYRGNTAAQMALAADYHEGRSVPPSKQAAADWLKRAAAGRNPDAMVQLAKLALAGDLPPHRGPALFPWLQAQPLGPSFDQARLWAQRAVAAGSQEGKVLLATILAQGPPEWQDDAASRSAPGSRGSSRQPISRLRPGHPARPAAFGRPGSHRRTAARRRGRGAPGSVLPVWNRDRNRRRLPTGCRRCRHPLPQCGGARVRLGTGTAWACPDPRHRNRTERLPGRNMAAHGRTRRKQRGRGVTG